MFCFTAIGIPIAAPTSAEVPVGSPGKIIYFYLTTFILFIFFIHKIYCKKKQILYTFIHLLYSENIPMIVVNNWLGVWKGFNFN